MGLVSETVWVNVGGSNKKYYQDLGYKIPERINKYGCNTTPKDTKIEIKITDIMQKSGAKVNCICDECGKKYDITFEQYNRWKKDNKIFCKKCGAKLYGLDNYNKTKLKNSVSFYQWCINKNREDVINRWDYNLNNCSPKEICYGSNIKYWFKCLDHPLHKSELKSINCFTHGQNGSIKCIQCNSFAQYLLDIYGENGIKKYWSNKNTISPWDITRHSSKKIYLICQNCGTTINTIPDRFCRQNLSCPSCSDGISYPEKFMYNLLLQLKNQNKINDFEFQKTFDWATYNESNNHKLNGIKIYDFYIKEYNIVIETHGRQHYDGLIRNNEKTKTQEEEDQNDSIKENLAKAHNKEYIPINCYYSNLDWIKKYIILSKLPIILKFKEEDIDWYECHKNSLSSLKKIVCDIWNSGIHSINEIKQRTKLGKTTIRRYLEQGKICGWCEYNADELRKEQYIKNKSLAKNTFQKSVICITTNLIYSSMTEAQKHVNISGISNCCTKRTKSAGKLPDGTPLQWQYLDEYMQQNGYTDPKDIPGVTIYEVNNT